MSLFWFLHRAAIAAIWLLLLAVAFVVWQHHAALQPAWDLVELAWNQQHVPAGGHGRLQGRGSRAYGATGFELRDANGLAFNYGLAGVGLAPGDAESSQEVKAFLELARSNLHQMIAGQPVVIEVLVGNPATRTGLGVAYLGDTNVNLSVLSGGFGQVVRDQIRSRPWRQQWEFLQAERTARAQSLGIWQTNLASLRLPAL